MLFNQFIHSVMSDSLRPHGLQLIRLPCLSPTPGAYSIHPHWVSDAIQTSHPLSPPSPAFNLFQHQGPFQCISSLHQVAKVLKFLASASILPMNIQDWSPLGLTGFISLQSKRLSRVFSNTTVQKHQFFSTQFSSQSNSHIHTWPQEKP